MTKRNRSARDIGMDSPGSETAKEQQIAGSSSGPQEAREAPRVSKQPPQTSNRRSAKHEHVASVRKHYDSDEDPNDQGHGDPSPHVVRDSDAMQGIGGSGERGRQRGREGAVEESQRGEPRGRHTPHDRQHLPGDRDPQQPS